MIKIGIVGFGYWGPNLARNFFAMPECELLAICEKNADLAQKAARMYGGVYVTDNYDELLNNDEIDAIVIATPVSTHYDLAKNALLAGKDVLIEKPLTHTAAEAAELIDIAEQNKRILAVDHTFLYTGAIRKIKEIIDSGGIGRIIYIDSSRLNLGLFQSDVNVIYDLAPHDLSIVCQLLGKEPKYVQAFGTSHEWSKHEYLAYLHLEYEDGTTAHFHFNWLAPVKVRRMLIGGADKMIVYDDMEPSEKVKIYDKGIVLKENDLDSIYKVYIDYRTGDMVAPKLEHREALAVEAEHFVDCVKNRTAPLTDGYSGLRVVKIIEAAQRSICNKGERIKMEGV